MGRGMGLKQGELLAKSKARSTTEVLEEATPLEAPKAPVAGPASVQQVEKPESTNIKLWKRQVSALFSEAARRRLARGAGRADYSELVREAVDDWLRKQGIPVP